MDPGVALFVGLVALLVATLVALFGVPRPRWRKLSSRHYVNRQTGDVLVWEDGRFVELTEGQGELLSVLMTEERVVNGRPMSRRELVKAIDYVRQFPDPEPSDLTHT